MKKSTKFKSLSQTDGKLETSTFKAQTLSQVWGDDGYDKYSTLNEEEYREKLADMNLSDLQSHATRVDLIPIANRDMLTQRLVKEFQKHVNSYKISSGKTSNKGSKVAVDILAEGR